jgi:hypothetical protein
VEYSKLCRYCQSSNPDIAQFCVNCGKNLGGVKTKFDALKRKMSHQAKEKLEGLRTSLDARINQYLNRLDTNDDLKVGNVSIPDSKRESIRNALLSFQERIGGEPETTLEFQEWLKDLPERIENERCIVCFGGWGKTDELVVCKHCQSGGHKVHLEKWIINQNSCPLCRQRLNKNDLITVYV